MKKLGLLALCSLLLAGCGHSTRSSGTYLGQITRHPDRFLGSEISVFGTVVSVDHTDEGTRFRIATVNYAYVFDVTFPGDVPKLAHDKDAYFLGKVTGAEKSVEAYSGVIVKIDALAVRPVGGNAIYLPENRRIAQQWLKGHLELNEVATAPGTEEDTEMASAPEAMPRRRAAARAETPTASYPGLEGLAEPAQLAEGVQAPRPAAPAQEPAYASQSGMGPPPPPPTAEMMAAAPIPAPAPAPVQAPPPVAVAAPAPAPVPVPAATYSAPPPAPASLSKAEAADLNLVNSRWNSLPDDVKAKIVRDIEQRTNFSDLTMIAQNWHSLPEEAKAEILKLIIESAR